MIIEYIRPKTIKEAVNLISRDAPTTIPMGGGTSLKRRAIQRDFSVVDLQALNLDQIDIDDTWIELGAMTTLTGDRRIVKISPKQSDMQFNGKAPRIPVIKPPWVVDWSPLMADPR